MPPPKGPTTSPLISPERLAERLGEPGIRVVDVRWYLGRPGDGRAAYDAGHIPGAIFLDIDGDLALAPGAGLPGRHPLPEPDRLRPPSGGRRHRR